MGYYNVGRRSKKWWKRDFAYLLEVSLLNAYVLQKFRNDRIKEQDYLAFRLALAVELVGNSCRRFWVIDLVLWNMHNVSG